ncbi:hypothetical protein BAE44_0000826, partial [Dichanthelium oligosanthes]
TSIAAGKSSPEWKKFRQIQQVKAYAHDDDNDVPRKWYVMFLSASKHSKEPIYCAATSS